MTKSYPSMTRLVERIMAQNTAFLCFLSASMTDNFESVSALACACVMRSRNSEVSMLADGIAASRTTLT